MGMGSFSIIMFGAKTASAIQCLKVSDVPKVSKKKNPDISR